MEAMRPKGMGDFLANVGNRISESLNKFPLPPSYTTTGQVFAGKIPPYSPGAVRGLATEGAKGVAFLGAICLYETLMPVGFTGEALKETSLKPLGNLLCAPMRGIEKGLSSLYGSKESPSSERKTLSEESESTEELKNEDSMEGLFEGLDQVIAKRQDAKKQEKQDLNEILHGVDQESITQKRSKLEERYPEAASKSPQELARDMKKRAEQQLGAAVEKEISEMLNDLEEPTPTSVGKQESGKTEDDSVEEMLKNIKKERSEKAKEAENPFEGLGLSEETLKFMQAKPAKEDKPAATPEGIESRGSQSHEEDSVEQGIGKVLEELEDLEKTSKELRDSEGNTLEEVLKFIEQGQMKKPDQKGPDLSALDDLLKDFPGTTSSESSNVNPKDPQ